MAGLFRIVPHFGRYRGMWENESLGSFTSPRRALTGLTDTSSLKLGHIADEARRALPIDLRQWTFVHLKRTEN